MWFSSRMLRHYLLSEPIYNLDAGGSFLLTHHFSKIYTALNNSCVLNWELEWNNSKTTTTTHSVEMLEQIFYITHFFVKRDQFYV